MTQTFRVTFKPAPKSGAPWYSLLVAAGSPAEARRLAEPRARIEAPRHRYASTTLASDSIESAVRCGGGQA